MMSAIELAQTSRLDAPFEATGPLREPGSASGRNARVTYWTGWLSPEMEGCSKEVFAFKEHFVRSRVFGLSRYYTLKVSRRDRYIGLNVELNAVFRLVAPLYEAMSDINHIYGGLREWFFLRALGRRPIVMTVVTSDAPFERRFYRHVRRFVVHAPTTKKRLVEDGFDPDSIRLIYPGVSLTHFRPLPRALAPETAWPTRDAARFRVLFATTPNSMEGLESRGINLLLQAARQLPDVEFYLPWRPWTGAAHLADGCRKQAPPNVHVSTGLVADMRHLLQAADATVAPFVLSGDMKVCPTSLVESLACGRPVLASTRVGIADLIDQEGCGQVFEPSIDAFCRAVHALRADYRRQASNARRTAERHFDVQACLRQHERLYDEIVRSSC